VPRVKPSILLSIALVGVVLWHQPLRGLALTLLRLPLTIASPRWGS